MTQYIGAMGIAVSDLEESTDFYCRIIGMKVLTTFNVSYMNENVLGFEGRGASLLLMNYIDGSNPNCKDNPIKIVIYVDDITSLFDSARAEGYEVIREPEVLESIGGALMGMVKDPDGYVVEMIQKKPKSK